MNQQPKKLIIFFIASVVLNVLLIGIISGMFLSKPSGFKYFKGFERMQQLPDEVKTKHKDALEANRKKIRENHQQIRSLRQQIAQTLSEPTIDKQHLESLFKQMNSIRQENIETSQNLMITIMLELNEQDRQEFLNQMSKDQKRKRR